MKAVVYSRYGPPEMLRLEEVDRPVPKDNEVLVQVRAVSVNASDWEILRGKPLYSRIGGPFRPRYRTLGSDIAGRVEATGPGVTRFRPGDEVFGDNLALMGGFAEYARAAEKSLALKPTGMSFEVAAAIPQAGVIALQGIRRKGNVQPGQRVLINGAGGGAGSFAVQLAKVAGAEVTGVDGTAKLDFLRSLGADHVVDYTREDFTRTGEHYDLVLDVIAHRSVFDYRRALAAGGQYLYVGGSVSTLLQILTMGPMIGRRDDRKVRILVVQPNAQDLLTVAELCQAGTIIPAIDKRFSLAEVPDALRYLGAGHAHGKLVITID
jgi:NADPH:quinone reductase-like Zn-dependent oxidoreductase